MSKGYEKFYTNQYKESSYAGTTIMENHAFYQELKRWLAKNTEWRKKKFLEIGSGRGALQDIVDDYTGLDFAQSVSKNYHKCFVNGSAMKMPFLDNTFDVVWSFAVWEHIPDPEAALIETIRVLKDGGIFLLCPAWHCRPWAAQGYQVRPYSDFGIIGKIYKLLIPVMNSYVIRGSICFLERIVAIIRMSMSKEKKLIYKKLKANYDIYWQSDSDACNNLDPFMVMLWFRYRGCKCVSHPNPLKMFFAGTGTIEIVISK